MNTPFIKTVEEAVQKFGDNALLGKLNAKSFKMEDYHRILLMIFHQTFEGPGTFSMVAAHSPLSQWVARDYLQHHADEEKTHWQWVIDDLKNTGYKGEDPRNLFPQAACQAYIAFNVYMAQRKPIARLGIAAVLESIGATYGKKYATQICQTLSLKPNQAKFFFGHGDTDVGHTADIFKVLDQCELNDEDWRYLNHAAKTAGILYKNMYEEVARF